MQQSITLEKATGELEAVLRELCEAHLRMSALLADKLGALRRADHKAVAASLGMENQQVQLIGELEKRRLTLAALLTQMIEPSAKAPWRLTELAQHLAEPARGRVLALRAQMVTTMQKVQKESAVTRRASEELVRHMQGLMRSVTSSVSGASVYGRSGQPPRAAMALSTFETRA
ncbi:MAG: flagellar protein FlgN [Phycisphaerales bacterium]|nr:flagellar protein FlgN [Phycisphaerales bacterium]